MKSIENVQTILAQVTRLAITHYQQREVREILESLGTHLNHSEKKLQEITTTLDSKEMNREYNAAMEAVCTNILEGTSFMLASAAGAGLLFTILIWVASHTWIHIRKKRSRSREGEEADPFLP